MTTIEIIKAEIERLKENLPREVGRCAGTITNGGYGMLVAYNNILAFIESLEKKSQRSYKDCNGCEYNRTVKDQIGWTFRGCFGGNYQGKPIAEIELCPLKLNRWKEQQADETLMEKDKIDTAFTKMMEKEQPQGLDEAADNYGREYCCEWWGGHSWVDDSEMLSLAFKAGAEWQREQIGSHVRILW